MGGIISRADCNCLFERKENLNNHYTNTECNREIENESISHPLECCLAPPRGASTPGWEPLTYAIKMWQHTESLILIHE